MGFEPTWEVASDTTRTWGRVGGPYPVLYHDVERVYRTHKRICWDAVASPMARDYDVRIMDGWIYSSGPAFDEAAGERLETHAASKGPVFEDWYLNVLRPEVVEIVERLRKHPRPTRPLPELVAHLEECFQAFGHVMGDLHWRMAAARVADAEGGRPTFQWPPIYAEITGRPESEAALLVSGLTNEMTKTVLALRKVARFVASDADLQKFVEAGDLEAIERDDREAFKAFRTRFRALLRAYGHRTGAGWGSALQLGAPTWNVRPQIPLQMIATYARADLDAIDRKERELLKERKRLERIVRRTLAKDPERLGRFEEELGTARAVAFFFEDHNDWMDQSTPGLVRDAAHVVGLRLVRDRVVDDPEDVLHLTLAELHDPPSDARSLVAQRARELERQQTLDPPLTLGAPTSEGPPLGSDEGEGRKGNVLHGIAASSGRYTGRARVCLPAPVPPDVEDGDILVAVDAGPDWTPMFAVLGAVVLDKGAAWQHAGVVAREFGIPAVTGTKVGTEAIADGSTITVDGDAGTVELSG